MGSAATAGLTTSECFQCGHPVPPDTSYAVEIDGRLRPVCCQGCATVARATTAAGRQAVYPTSSSRGPEALHELKVFDRPDVQRSFVHHSDERTSEVSLLLEGVTCAGCVSLIEHHLARLPGVDKVEVNYSTRRARIRWDALQTRLSEILTAVRGLGYDAHPYDQRSRQESLERERKQLLRRLGVAGVFGMQVMTLAVALYAGAWSGIESEFKDFFQRMSLLLTAPVLFYSAQPFFRAAWAAASKRTIVMDAPISLGIALAFGASVWATFSGHGHVYYDSVVMFVFFLLGARYLELSARRRVAGATDIVAYAAPQTAIRLNPDDPARTGAAIAAIELRVGDLVLIRPGDVVPADGDVVEGRSTVNESILTGETLPQLRQVGDHVLEASVNSESPLIVRVTGTGSDTVRSEIQRLLDRAEVEKPRIAQLADQIAGWFLGAVLILAAGTALVWWYYDPERWLPTTVALLVVACPCALSLATPTAIASSVSMLLGKGALMTRGHVLETLNRVTHFVFDKTGTLTTGHLRLVEARPLDSNRSVEDCLALAASLERHSEHPVARAIVEAAGDRPLPAATRITNRPGAGLTGVIEGELIVIGTPNHLQACTGLEFAEGMELDDMTSVVLANEKEPICVFRFADEPREDAADVLQYLRAQSRSLVLLTGDRQTASRRLASQLGIEDVHAGLTPQQKLQHIRALQAKGAVVAMIGDGINDAPVLGGAQVSIAVAGATALAAISADTVLLNPNLRTIAVMVETARRTLNVIRQSMVWAAGYNLIAIPAAALGYVPPWLAALGMSASSLIVVANAYRLRRSPAAAGA
ncbi:MAG: heavy metal translocating P-type ATPase [Gammaproteobacteria bacterium]